jgi:hypothetical protein
LFFWLTFGAGLKLLGGLGAWLAVPAAAPARSAATISPSVHAAALLVFATAGFLLVVGGRHDRRARSLAVVYILFASVFADPLLGRAVPALAGWASILFRVLERVQFAAFLPLALWDFVRDFPLGESRLSPWLSCRLMTRLSRIAGTVLFLASLVAGPAGPFWVIVVLLEVPALAYMVFKYGNVLPEERRRAGVFAGGLLAGTAPVLLDILLRPAVPAYAQLVADPARNRAVGYLLVAFVMVIPATTAYAVVVDRVFDLRFIIRRAIQYALARLTVLACLAAPAVALVAYLLENRARPLGELIANPSSIGLWLTAGVFVSLLVVRRPLLTAIDRKFFREQYDTRKTLMDLVLACRKATGSSQLAMIVASGVDRALHVERIAILLRDAQSDAFRDPSGAVGQLASSGPLSGLVSAASPVLNVDLSSPSSRLRNLPDSEVQWLADTGAHLLVPFLSAHDRLIGMLLLGEKMSGVPYTREDRQLLAAVASSAALGFEQWTRVERSPDSGPAAEAEQVLASQCGRCGRLYSSEGQPCPECGGPLTRSLLPLVLRNKFKVERQIGAGGMGVVYLARDTALGRDVALKTLPRVSPEECGQLRREARSMASLQHAHLAVIHGIEVWRGLPVLVLEYLAGGTLAARLRRAPLPPVQVVSLGVAIADALHHLHRAGLLHRDVKPSNIGFTADGEPKLLDFGLAGVGGRESALDPDPSTASGLSLLRPRHQRSAGEDASTCSRRLVGTAPYLSPEAIRFHPPEPGFDLWALAVTLFEAATAAHPFARGGIQETLERIEAAEAPDLAAQLPGCPAGLAAFFREALAGQRERRPATALQFSARLRILSRDVEATLAGAATPTGRR